MIKKPILLHHTSESGSQREAEVFRSALGRGTGKYIALAGISVVLAALRKARQSKHNLLHDTPHDVSDAYHGFASSIPGWNLLFQKNLSPMWICDQSRIIDVNDEALAQTGFSRFDFLRLELNDLLVGSIAHLGTSSSDLFQLRRKDGSIAQVRISSTEMTVNHRRLKTFSAKALDQSEARVRAFSDLGYRLCSAHTQTEAIQIILSTADQFFGWDACTFDRYCPETDLIHPIIVIDRLDGIRKDIEPVIKNSKPTARMRKVLNGGPQLTLRKAPIRMDSDSVAIGDRSRPSASIMSVPIRSSSRVIGLLSIQSYKISAYTAEDLHLLQSLADHGAGAIERIQIEETMRALNADLENRVTERTAALKDAVRELEAFSYGISHDMRAPLRAMEGYTHKLLEDYRGKTLDEEAAEYLSRISRSAVRLDMLIQDVLTYTNVARCNAPLAPVNVDQLLADLMETYPDWHARQARIEVLSPLPTLMANEALLTQCLSHLIDNALKFVPSERTAHVRIWAMQDDTKVRIWVEDNGAGIANKDSERVFGLFERIHPTPECVGTGVGLTIVKKAVERMGGTVGFESEVGKGSRFWFELAAASQI